MDEIAHLDKQISELQERKNKLWRAKTITLGELLDLSNSLSESLHEGQWRTGWRLDKILEKL